MPRRRSRRGDGKLVLNSEAPRWAPSWRNWLSQESHMPTDLFQRWIFDPGAELSVCSGAAPRVTGSGREESDSPRVRRPINFRLPPPCCVAFCFSVVFFPFNPRVIEKKINGFRQITRKTSLFLTFFGLTEGDKSPVILLLFQCQLLLWDHKSKI